MSRNQSALTRWLLVLLLVILVAPTATFALGRGKKKPAKDTAQEPQETTEVAGIINRVIASENLYSIKLSGFSPRIETYVQYYQPDNELGDVATNDAIFLGRLKFEGDGKEVSFVQSDTPDWLSRHIPSPSRFMPTRLMGSRPHLQLDAFAI